MDYASSVFDAYLVESFVAIPSVTQYIQIMQETEALTIMSALAQSTRLKVLVLLAAAGDAGMASSEIADSVGVPRHLMSAHLAVLSRARVVNTHKAGRTVTYSVCTDAVRRLNGYLGDLVETRDSSS